MSHKPFITSRTHIFVLESTESSAQIFLSLKEAFNSGDGRDLEDESDITVTEMNGPVDAHMELRVCRMWRHTDNDTRWERTDE